MNKRQKKSFFLETHIFVEIDQGVKYVHFPEINTIVQFQNNHLEMKKFPKIYLNLFFTFNYSIVSDFFYCET